MDVVYILIKDIKPYAGNPRNNEAGVDKVAESIKTFGFKQPIVVDKDNVIIVGHTRYRAAQKLGFEKVPVLIATDLSPAKSKAYRIADNRVAQESTWKDDLLKIELEELSKLSFDFKPLGMTDLEIERVLNLELFSPVAENPDDRLDRKKKVSCPNCGEVFEP